MVGIGLHCYVFLYDGVWGCWCVGEGLIDGMEMGRFWREGFG